MDEKTKKRIADLKETVRFLIRWKFLYVDSDLAAPPPDVLVEEIKEKPDPLILIEDKSLFNTLGRLRVPEDIVPRECAARAAPLKQKGVELIAVKRVQCVFPTFEFFNKGTKLRRNRLAVVR